MGAYEKMMVMPDKIRLCHVLSGDGWGGAEAMAFGLMAQQREYTELDVQAVILNHGILQDRLVNMGIETTVLDEARYSFQRLVSMLHDHIQSKGVHIMHTHRYKENVLVLHAFNRYQSGRVVRTFHSIPQVGLSLRGIKMWAYRAYDFRMCRRQPDPALVAVSKLMTSQLKHYIHGKPIKTVHNGISIPVSPVRRELNTRYPLILAVGRLVPVKGFDVLLKAVSRFRDNGHVCRLVVLGEGPQYSELIRQRQSLNLDDVVEFPGFHADVSPWIDRAHLFVLPSRSEGIPMALLEAMASGIPVLASDTGGIPEVIGRDSSCGLLFPSGDDEAMAGMLADCLQDYAQTASMGWRGSERIRSEFSVEKMTESYQKLYRQLLNPMDAA